MSSLMSDPHAHHYMHCLPFGAQLIGAARAKPQTRFRFWAPSCRAVQVVFDDARADDGSPIPPLEMTDTGSGWFEAQAPCGPGTRYRYRIDDGQEVPDPASRFQPQGVHGPSLVLDPRAYAWQHAQWMGRPWEETVLYELHVGALGGYRNVAARLPALAALGVTAVELMPLNDYPGERGWGYDGVLPYAPHAAYGTPDELKTLIDTAHGLGLQVFIDVVYNHFGPDGNRLGDYAKPFFRTDAKTPWGDAPDFERFEVRDFFCDNALYWLTEYRFDGLRIDATCVHENESWLRELSDHVEARIEEGRHVHLVLENERNAANLLGTHFDAQWNDDAHHALHVLLTGETDGYYGPFASHPIRQLARVLAEGIESDNETTLPPSALVMFLQNHDQVGNRARGERLRTLSNDDALRAATALYLLTPQIPLMFMDEEYGSTQPFQYFAAYTGDLADALRAGRAREFASFTAYRDPAQRTRLPDPNDARTFADSSPPLDTCLDGDRRTWMHFYKSALAVRARLLTPRLSHARALGATVLTDDAGNDYAALVAHWRLADGEILTLALNLGHEAVPLNHEPDGMIVFETPDRARDRIDEGLLPAYSCVAWMTGDVPDYALHHDARVVRREEPGA